MAVGSEFKLLVNARPVGSEAVVSDFYDFPGPPAIGTQSYRTVELPLNVITAPSITDPVYIREVHPSTHVPLGPVLTMVSYPVAPLSGQFQINSVDTFKVGTILFNTLDAGKTYEIIYTGRGSLIFAEDILNLNYGLSLLPEVIKPGHISADVADAFTFPGDVTVNGDFNVAGTSNHLLSEIWTTVDNFVRLNSDFTTGSPTVDAGLQISRGSSPDAALTWDETADEWVVTGGPLSVPLGISVNRFDTLATASQTVFTLPWQYNAGTNQLMVFRGGLLQSAGASLDYQETSISGGLSNEVTFTVGLDLNEQVSFVVIGA